MKKIIFLLFLFISTTTTGQTILSSKIIRIGDTIPALTLFNVDNSPGDSISLSKLVGKNLIIDFWNRWCGTCIGTMAKLQRLQPKYKDSLLFITVTNDSKEDYDKLKKRSTTVSKLTLPVVVGDSILNSLFPHQGVPYYVWVDKNGIVKGMSNQNSVIDQNLTYFIRNGKLSPQIVATDTLKSLDNYLSLQKKQLNGITYYSGFKKENKTIRVLPNKDSNKSPGNTKSTYYIDRSLINFFSIISGKPTRSITTLDSTLSYILNPTRKDSYERWKSNTSYSYIIQIKEGVGSLKPFMKNDFTDHFGIELKDTILKRKTFVLKRISVKNRMPFAGGISEDDPFLAEVMGDDFILKNAPMDVFIEMMEDALNIGNDPMNFKRVVNETGINAAVSMELKTDGSIEGMNRSLKKYGLEMKEDDRVLEFQVLEKSNKAINRELTHLNR